MSLEIGQSVGPYEIIERAGAGGMGEVFKARDTRLDRTVAIKVLPAEIAGMPNFQQRFEREAKSISSLNHPNICTLFDVGHQDGLDFLVMEYLEGETLSDRLLKGPIPYEEMLQIAVQIAAGLDSAHQQGMVHRDLKPGNVMLTKEGAKLLDFGLAKLHQAEEGGEGLSPLTQTTPLTGAGTILGTMQYMAPEQLEGKEADARSDIFAFGAILYEMATGRRAFEGASSATLIAAIIEREPAPISVIVPDTPPMFERLVKKCLSKDPQKRWQSASDLSDELRWMSQAGSQVGLPAHIAAKRRLKFTLARVVGAVAICTTLIFAYLYYAEVSQPAVERPVSRFTINVRQGLRDVYWPRISPDGLSVAFRASDSLGHTSIWIRPVNSLDAYPLLNTEGSNRFFWSPDSKSLAFFVGNQLKRIPITGGQAQLICQGPNGADGSWSDNDLIIFDGQAGDTIKIVAAGGGIPRPAAPVDTAAGEIAGAWPWFLPGGKNFIYTANARQTGDDAGATTYLKLGFSDSLVSRKLYDVPGVSRVEYSPEGYILYVQNDNLIALPFDAQKLEVTGEPKPVAMKIGAATNTYAFGVSNTGVLLYQTNNQTDVTEIAWYDRSGKKLGTVGPIATYSSVRLSPDGSRIAYNVLDPSASHTDIWVYDLRRNVPTRLTFGRGDEGFPVWSPDGQRVYYVSDQDGEFINIYRRLANSTGDEEPVYQTDSSYVVPTDFTPDGAGLLFMSYVRSYDIAVLYPEDSNRVDWLANSNLHEAYPKVSPNGKYVGYISFESGQWEIYVRRFGEGGGKWQISTEHADDFVWSRDGTELFYHTFDDRLMAVKVTTDGDFTAGNPEELFEVPTRHRPGFFSESFDISPDGQKFLVNARARSVDPGEIVVVENWAQELKGK